MNEKIWRVLTHILCGKEDSNEILKPFFLNLNNNNNINDKKFIPFLNTFTKYQLEVLYQNKILSEDNFSLLISAEDRYKEDDNDHENDSENDIDIEKIVSGDKIKEFQELIQVKDIQTFNTIIKSFKEVNKKRIPLIQYCIMKNAIECFNFLLVNGYDDPKKVMNNQNPCTFLFTKNYIYEEDHLYEWDCMATAIYFGNMEIIKILESRGIKKGTNPVHIEAAIFSYRNKIAEEILNEMNEGEMQNYVGNNLDIGILTSAKVNNIKGAQLLIRKGANINAKSERWNSILKIINH